jgi:DNA-directed RNA polymerase subunit RPC12/RpoP
MTVNLVICLIGGIIILGSLAVIVLRYYFCLSCWKRLKKTEDDDKKIFWTGSPGNCFGNIPTIEYREETRCPYCIKLVSWRTVRRRPTEDELRLSGVDKKP